MVELSDRERQIVLVLCTGAANKTIARQLGIADGTVKVHLKAICRKMGVSNRTQVVVKAILNGISLSHRLDLAEGKFVRIEPEFS